MVVLISCIKRRMMRLIRITTWLINMIISARRHLRCHVLSNEMLRMRVRIVRVRRRCSCMQAILNIAPNWARIRRSLLYMGWCQRGRHIVVHHRRNVSSSTTNTKLRLLFLLLLFATAKVGCLRLLSASKLSVG